MTNPVPSRSILLVEDEKDSLEILTTILTGKFPDVIFHTATNGRMALELFKEHLPDIVITDVNMPEMGGVQMAGKIHEIRPGTKIIVLTADTVKVTLENAAGAGFEFNQYVLKPVDFNLLFAAIEQCIADSVLAA